MIASRIVFVGLVSALALASAPALASDNSKSKDLIKDLMAAGVPGAGGGGSLIPSVLQGDTALDAAADLAAKGYSFTATGVADTGANLVVDGSVMAGQTTATIGTAVTAESTGGVIAAELAAGGTAETAAALAGGGVLNTVLASLMSMGLSAEAAEGVMLVLAGLAV